MKLLDVIKIADLPREELTPELFAFLNWTSETGAHPDYLDWEGIEHLYNVMKCIDGLSDAKSGKLINQSIIASISEIKEICDANDCSFFRFITP